MRDNLFIIPISLSLHNLEKELLKKERKRERFNIHKTSRQNWWHRNNLARVLQRASRYIFHEEEQVTLEASFMRMHAGVNVWSQAYYKTRHRRFPPLVFRFEIVG